MSLSTIRNSGAPEDDRDLGGGGPGALAKSDSTPEAGSSQGTERDLEPQRAYFRALAEQSLDIISVLDALGTIRFESPSVERWTGWKPEELVGENAFKFVHPGDYAKVLALFTRGIVRPGSTEMVQYRFRHKNGSWRVLESWGKNLLANESVRGVVVNSRDVTERIEHEQRYRALVERLPVAVIVHQAGVIVFANPAAAKMLATTSVDDLVGRSVFDIVPDETKAAVSERIRRAGHGEVLPWMEQKVTRLDGSQAHVEAASIGTTHLGKSAVQTIFHEITGRKQAEERKAVQYAATRALAQASSDDTVDQFLRIICEGLHWKVGEFWVVDAAGGRLHLVSTSQPADATCDAFVARGQAVACGTGEGLPGRVWAERRVFSIPDVTADGEFLRRDAAAAAGLRGAVAFPVFAGETFRGVIQVFSETEAEPDAELIELLKVLGTQLGQFLERKQIQEQFFQAQKMEAVGQLAGGVAHDFNNILTVITGHAQLVLGSPALPPELRAELSELTAAVDCAANLTRQLLTFSRKQVVQKRSLDLGVVINDLAKMLGRIIGEEIVLTLNHDPRTPCIEGDIGMIEQIVMNLAVNSRDAMPAGGTLAISIEPVEIQPEYVRSSRQGQGRFVRVTVRDTGCGIAPEVLPRVFEPFFTTKPLGRGTGLGLATVYGIVKEHEGWIEVDSQVQAGTTFRIFFPAKDLAPAAKGRAAAPGAPVRGTNQTILLVEDEAAVRVLARKLLERGGYRIVEAACGSEALQVWMQKRDEIDVVLTDLVMPGGMTGRQLAERLRAENAELPIIFTSGYSGEFVDETIERERIPFIAKPYSPQQLLETVGQVLGR